MVHDACWLAQDLGFGRSAGEIQGAVRARVVVSVAATASMATLMIALALLYGLRTARR